MDRVQEKFLGGGAINLTSPLSDKWVSGRAPPNILPSLRAEGTYSDFSSPLRASIPRLRVTRTFFYVELPQAPQL